MNEELVVAAEAPTYMEALIDISKLYEANY